MIFHRRPNQHYDAWLHWEITTKCNLSCDHCYWDERVLKPTTLRSRFLKTIGKSPQDPRITGKLDPINIKSLLSTLNKTKKVFRISFTGGEPFLIPNIIEACQELSRRHYLSFNTNLVSPKAAEFAQKIDPRRILFVISSLHLKELERLRLVDRFINNFKTFQSRDIPIFAAAVAHPSLVPEVRRYREFYQSHGVSFKFDQYFGYYKNQYYPKSYTNSDLDTFGLTPDDPKIFTKWQGRPCIAGHTVLRVTTDGSLTRCFEIQNYHGNINHSLTLDKKPQVCPIAYCTCPFTEYDPYLAAKAGL